MVKVLPGLLLAASFTFAQASRAPLGVERLLDRPIITPELHPSIGPNIQAPSLIKVPDWVEKRLGRYYRQRSNFTSAIAMPLSPATAYNRNVRRFSSAWPRDDDQLAIAGPSPAAAQMRQRRWRFMRAVYRRA